MSGARDETIRKKQAKGVAARVAFPVRGLGLGPIGRGRFSGGVADPRSKCPFGAERARSEPPCAEPLASLRRCGERPGVPAELARTLKSPKGSVAALSAVSVANLRSARSCPEAFLGEQRDDLCVSKLVEEIVEGRIVNKQHF